MKTLIVILAITAFVDLFWSMLKVCNGKVDGWSPPVPKERTWLRKVIWIPAWGGLALAWYLSFIGLIP